MIVVDANIFLTFLLEPVTPHDQRLLSSAMSFFERVAEGIEHFTTSDAVIAEVVYVLARRDRDRSAIAGAIRRFLELPGCRYPNRAVVADALARWTASGNLSFVDALVAAQARSEGAILFTFDRALAANAGVDPYEPES